MSISVNGDFGDEERRLRIPVGWYEGHKGQCHCYVAAHLPSSLESGRLNVVFATNYGEHAYLFQCERLSTFMDQMRIDKLGYIGTETPVSLCAEDAVLLRSIPPIKIKF